MLNQNPHDKKNVFVYFPQDNNFDPMKQDSDFHLDATWEFSSPPHDKSHGLFRVNAKILLTYTCGVLYELSFLR